MLSLSLSLPSCSRAIVRWYTSCLVRSLARSLSFLTWRKKKISLCGQIIVSLENYFWPTLFFASSRNNILYLLALLVAFLVVGETRTTRKKKSEIENCIVVVVVVVIILTIITWNQNKKKKRHKRVENRNHVVHFFARETTEREGEKSARLIEIVLP